MKLRNKVKKWIKRSFKLFRVLTSKDQYFFYKGFKKFDLIIYDDLFPHPISGFRNEEFKELLSKFINSKILLQSSAYPIVNSLKSQHEDDIADFKEHNKTLENKLEIKRGFININTKLFYCIFLNNIYENIDLLEDFKIPFVFTLYPGGGFKLNESLSDLKLRRVLSSLMFRGVIVTQNITHDYLTLNKLCPTKDIHFIFGCVVPQISATNYLANKKYYLVDKPTFDICFCAAKYTEKGIDKGYDVFIAFAHLICKEFDFVRFHIIGGFDENDIDVSELQDKISFWGYQNFNSLGTIYKKMDAIVSPNVPFMLSKGAFDGFPLGTVIEAALNGVVVLVTDELKQNSVFCDGEDLIIIQNDVNSIAVEIRSLINSPQRLKDIADVGRKKFMEVYANDKQLSPRVDILKNMK